MTYDYCDIFHKVQDPSLGRSMIFVAFCIRSYKFRERVTDYYTLFIIYGSLATYFRRGWSIPALGGTLVC